MSLDNYYPSFERQNDLKMMIQPSLARAAVEGFWRKMGFPDMRYAVLHEYNLDHLPSLVTVGELTRDERAAVGLGPRVIPHGEPDEFGFRPAIVSVPHLDKPLTLRQSDKLRELRGDQWGLLSGEGEHDE